jgi:hypothetical protein
MKPYSILRFGVVLGALLIAQAASAQFFGAIYTSTFDGTIVNANIYADKNDVYMNGGPHGNSFHGLPDGTYFFQVTKPGWHPTQGDLTDGLLSTDDANDRQLKVVGGRVFGVAGTAGTHAVGVPTANGGLPVQLMPYSDTPNPGGEYKAWLIRWKDENGNIVVPSTFVDSINPRIIHFESRWSKTDNFKVRVPPPPYPTAIVKGVKFRDLNMNGLLDPTDEPLQNWVIHVVGNDPQTGPFSYDAVTNVAGEWTSNDMAIGSTFTLTEEQQAGWMQTGPRLGAAWRTNNIQGDTVALGQADMSWVGSIPATTSDLEIISGHNFGNIDMAKLCGVKWYDHNANGVRDAEDEGIVGWRIKIDTTWPDGSVHSEVKTTGLDGGYCSSDMPVGSRYVVSELMPQGTWVQTYPSAGGTYQGTISEGGADGLDFGNYCIVYPSEGRTLGFWHNRNGKLRLAPNDPAWRNLLNALCLRNGNGTHFDIPLNISFNSAHSMLASWLIGANATNMANMTSAQLAACALNVAYNGLNGSLMVILPPSLAACFGQATISIQEIMNQANASLCANGNTVSGPDRAYQECRKTALDMINNNQLGSIGPGPCYPLNYGAAKIGEGSKTPDGG